MLGSVCLLSQLIHDVDDIGSGFLPKTTAMRAPSPVLTRLVQRAAVSRTSKPSNVESVDGYNFPALLGPFAPLLAPPLASQPRLNQGKQGERTEDMQPRSPMSNRISPCTQLTLLTNNPGPVRMLGIRDRKPAHSVFSISLPAMYQSVLCQLGAAPHAVTTLYAVTLTT